MDDWAISGLQTAAPFAVAGLVALLTPALLPVRGLRRDLAVDAGTLERLPAGAVQDALRDNVEDRAVRLVAWTRYPTLNRTELFSFVLSVGLAGSALWHVMSDLTGDRGNRVGALLSFVVSVAAMAIWLLAMWSWHQRATDRFDYLRSLGAPAAVAAGRRGIKIAVYPLVVVLALIVVVQLLAAANVAAVLGTGPVVAVLAAVGWALVLVASTLGLAETAPRDELVMAAEV